MSSADQASSFKRERSLRRANGPAGGFAHGREGMAMEGRRAMLAQGLEVVGRAIAFGARQTVLWIDGVPLFHSCVPMRFREDRGCGEGVSAAIAFAQAFLLGQT